MTLLESWHAETGHTKIIVDVDVYTDTDPDGHGPTCYHVVIIRSSHMDTLERAQEFAQGARDRMAKIYGTTFQPIPPDEVPE